MIKPEGGFTTPACQIHTQSQQQTERERERCTTNPHPDLKQLILAVSKLDLLTILKDSDFHWDFFFSCEGRVGKLCLKESK